MATATTTSATTTSTIPNKGSCNTRSNPIAPFATYLDSIVIDRIYSLVSILARGSGATSTTTSVAISIDLAAGIALACYSSAPYRCWCVVNVMKPILAPATATSTIWGIYLISIACTATVCQCNDCIGCLIRKTRIAPLVGS